MKRGHVIGVELNEKICQISYFDEALREPKTVEVNADNYQIPLVIGRRGQDWVYGTEAQSADVVESGNSVSDILSHAMRRELVQVGENTYEGIWLLSLYIQLALKGIRRIEAITFTMPEMNVDIAQLLRSVGQKLGVEKENIYVQDYKESFCYYMWYQSKELWQFDAALLYCDRNEIKTCMLKKQRSGLDRGKNVFVTVEDMDSISIEELADMGSALDEEKAKTADEKFGKFVRNVFTKKMVSSVFLTGDGFEQNWYPNALRALCNGRRVFQGNNLYSRGACYAAYSKVLDQQISPVYLDETKLTEQISLKLRVKGLDVWHPIVSWGNRWYESDKQFEILLEDKEDIEIHVESLKNREMQVIQVPMGELPDRTNYTLRLQVNVIFIDENTCKITWKDIGFGEFFEPSGFQKETEIRLGGNNGQFNSLS